ncbi:MAG TPA: extracellular solute-binding protein [Roseiflexaceae bacterium]|nr:extracellular solute-binding protein [Roseiflexaceae bacterium]
MLPFRRIFALLVVSLLLGACSGAGPAPDIPAGSSGPTAGQPPSPDSASLTLTFGAWDWERPIFQPLIERFNRENPDMQVQFVALDPVFSSGVTDTDGQLRMIASAADTAMLHTLSRGAIERGYLLDLAPMIAADRAFDPADFFPGALESVSIAGGTYMLPRSITVSLLSYNKALWDRAGLKTPEPDWTWDDLLAAAEQIARKRGDTVEVYGMVDGSGFGVLNGLLAQSTGAGLSGMAGGPERFARPELLAALERVNALARSGALLTPLAGDGQLVPVGDKITSQQVGIWESSMYLGDPDGPGPDFSIGLLPMPRSKSGVPRGTSGYVISGGTQHREAAWRWLSFLTHQQIDQPTGIGPVETMMPARRSVAEASGFWSTLDAEARAAIEATLDSPAPPELHSSDPDFSTALAGALSKMLGGQQSPAEALEQARVSYEQALAAAGPTGAPAGTGPVAVATPVPALVLPEGVARVRFGAFGFDPTVLRQQAEAFNRSQPAVFVEIVALDSSGGLPMLTLAGQAAASDAFLWYGPPPAAELTATLDLRPLADADPGFSLDDYPAGLLAAFERDGRLVGLPHALDLLVVQYNRQVFEQAGVAPPAAGWTLEQFIETAQRLTSGQGEDRRYGFSTYGTSGLDFVLDASGASLTAGEGAQLRPNFTDPKVVEAARRFIELARSATPDNKLDGYRNTTVGETLDLVRQGRVGMWLGYGMSPGIFSGAGFDTGIAAPPLADYALNQRSVGFTGLYISAGAADKEAAWQWITYLSQSLESMPGRFPARGSVALSEAFAQQAPPGAADLYRAYSAALADGPVPALQRQPGADEVERYWFYRAVDRVLRGEAVDLERALEEAQTLTERHLGCVRAGDTPASCAQQVDPSYDGALSQG